MKIGIYCGLANNMYVFAHGLAKQGFDVCFVRDRSDQYPMSQPVWEDIPFRMDYAEVPRAALWPWDRWNEFEKAMNWIAPEWLYDPLADLNSKLGVTTSARQGTLDSLFLKRYARVPHRASALRRMRSCDVLFVSGVEGSVLANASGRPFIIWPFGGDLLIAAGRFQPELYSLRPRLVHGMLRRQLIAAYDNALCIGAHEPTALLTDFYGAEHFLRNYTVTRIAIPFAVRKRGDKITRRKQTKRLLAELGVEAPSYRYLGFVPSRIDYEWKGQDRLLRALVRLERAERASNVHLIFSGWGHDFDRARQFVHDNDLEKQVTFLKFALSKPLLYEFYLNADFVVDQFIVGMCGTSALEAMACGAPLITWINTAVERPWGSPPVLQARTECEIAMVLADISEGRSDLDQAGALLQQWIAHNYDPADTASNLLAAFASGRPNYACCSPSA